MSIINPSIGIVLTSSTAFSTSLAVLITSEYNKNLKIGYSKLNDWINVITNLYEKNLKQSMIDEKIAEKEALDLKMIYNHYLDKTKETLKNTQFKVKDKLGDVISKNSVSPEQITILNKFLAQTI